MPIVTISGTPHWAQDTQLEVLKQVVITRILAVPELGLRSRKQVTVFIPSDRLRQAQDSDVVVNVVLTKKLERTDEVRARIARDVGCLVSENFPDSFVEVLVNPFDEKNGYWSIRPPSKE